MRTVSRTAPSRSTCSDDFRFFRPIRGSRLEQDELRLGKSLKLPGEGRTEAADSGERQSENPPPQLKFLVPSLCRPRWSGLALFVTLV
jgi:hypothetical protein